MIFALELAAVFYIFLSYSLQINSRTDLPFSVTSQKYQKNSGNAVNICTNAVKIPSTSDVNILSANFSYVFAESHVQVFQIQIWEQP